ncbi:MAG: AAA family ATPase, partial [Rubripirellula sp.]|nr:AAA family ATPase [Rubripirellula sp.]
KARALLKGRTHVTLEDVQILAYPVLRHRIVPTFAAEAEGVTVDDLITRMIKTQTAAPAKVM